MTTDLAQRSVRSVTWVTLANLIALPVNFIQSVLLARLLAVEYFGVYAGMSSIMMLSSVFFEFGLGNAYLHRSQETLDEDKAVSIVFTLRLIFDTLWLVSFLLFGLLVLSGLNRLVFLVLLVSTYVNRLTIAPRLLLVRQVQHRRLAILDLVINVITTVFSLLIAFLSHSIWALLISPLIATAFGIIGIYFVKPIWKPKLSYARSAFRYFLSFGSRNLANSILDSAIENFDNIFTSIFLGEVWLGFYSRAFKFAIYPRMILSTPVNSVVLGTYAELKDDRRRLSRAFFQANAFLIRAGFLLAGWLAVIAPQFIRLLIGERWMPMLDAFRLMLIFSLLDPVKGTISSVFVSVGVPEKISIVRIAQLSVMILGLLTLGIRYQIVGVALSVDLMIVTGTVLSLVMVQKYIDVSFFKLFAAPVVSLITGIGLVLLFNTFLPTLRSDLLTAVQATLVFGVGYVVILFILEGKQILISIGELVNFSGGLGYLPLPFRLSPAIKNSSIKYFLREKTTRARSKLKRVIHGHRERYERLNLVRVDPGVSTKQALVSYISEPIHIPKHDPRYYTNNNILFVQVLVKSLNELGYDVDLIDYRDTRFFPRHPYQLFIGHGGINFTQIAERLPELTRKIYFSTGSYWKFSNEQEKTRFEALYQRKGVRLPYDRLIPEGEEAALAAAHAILGIGNDTTRSTYAQFPGFNNRQVIMINGSALPDSHFDRGRKDYERGRQNYLYYAGPGCVHKGLDLLLDAFAGLEQHLWISSKMEPQFSQLYRNELHRYSNIHLTGWTLPRSAGFYRLMQTCNYTILPSCSEGQSQSTVECMNQGLIPVISRFSGIDVGNFGVMLEDCTIEEIRQIVCSLSSYSLEHCQELSLEARQAAINQYSEATFDNNLRSALEILTRPV